MQIIILLTSESGACEYSDDLGAQGRQIVQVPAQNMKQFLYLLLNIAPASAVVFHLIIPAILYEIGPCLAFVYCAGES